MRLPICLVAAVLPMIMPEAALAQDSGVKMSGTIYLWLPSIDSNVDFPRTGAQTVTIEAGDILENLEFGLMGSATIRKGRLGATVDLVYSKLAGGESASREILIGERELPLDASAEIDFESTMWVVSLVGRYAAIETDRLSVDLVGGTRLFDMDQEVDYVLSGNVGPVPAVDRSGSLAVGVSNWDAIVGVGGRFRFGRDARWFVPFHADVGAGESKLTWQAVGGLGYAFGWGDVWVAYRHLGYELSGPVEDFSLHGPGLAATLRF